MSQICIYAVIALSLTVLTGWAGQVSLGQFGLVAVGALMASHLGSSVPLILLLPFAGAVTAVVAVVIGLPALRVRGLYLAVSTLAFSLWLMGPVLATTCWTVPRARQAALHRPPQPAVDADRAAEHLRDRSRVRARLRLVLPRRPGPLRVDGPAVARPGGRASTDRRYGTTSREPGRRASRSRVPSCWPSPCRGSSPATPGSVWRSPPSASRRAPSTRPTRCSSSRWWSSAASTRSPGRCSARVYLVGPPGDLRHHADDPVPHQRARAPRVHPLSPGRPGRAHAPTRRPGDRRDRHACAGRRGEPPPARHDGPRRRRSPPESRVG